MKQPLNLTPEEQERLAYISGDTQTAALLARARAEGYDVGYLEGYNDGYGQAAAERDDQ